MAFDALSLPAGTLRHTVTISSTATSGGTFGTSVITAIVTTRASLEQITAKSMFQTGTLSTVVSHKLRMRYRSDIVLAPGNTVTYGTKTYRVINVDDIQERHRTFELLLLEISGTN